MPNLKIYADEGLAARADAALRASLPALQALLVARLQVPLAACQLAILPVITLNENAALNVELQILPAAARDHALLSALAQEIRTLLDPIATGRVAVRISQLDPETYVALK